MSGIELTLAHSPDGDDMVMFWPLTGVHTPDGRPIDGPLGRAQIDTGGIVFRTLADDVQRLNRRAIDRADLDISAISAHTYPHVQDRYVITACAGSFGEGYGPKVVVRQDSPIETLEDLLEGATMVVPGLQTTAYLVLCICAGRRLVAEEMLFSEIPRAVADGDYDAGVLIHEAQLSFASLGLRPIADLGEVWGRRTGLPLPLGLNVVRRDLDERFGPGTLARVAGLLRASVAHAMEHREQSRAFLRLHAAGRPEWLDDALVDRYLDMYVSELTRDMGRRGREALACLFEQGSSLGLIPGVRDLDVV